MVPFLLALLGSRDAASGTFTLESVLAAWYFTTQHRISLTTSGSPTGITFTVQRKGPGDASYVSVATGLPFASFPYVLDAENNDGSPFSYDKFGVSRSWAYRVLASDGDSRTCVFNTTASGGL